MREIKYQVWDRAGNQMWDESVGDWKVEINGSEIKLLVLTEKWIQTDIDDSNSGYQQLYWQEIEDAVFRQYTGLKDKNGREIYEGDILANKKAFNRSFKVIWNPDGAWFVHDGDDWPCYYLRQVNGSTEVIGNVFEHPELLEVKEGD